MRRVPGSASIWAIGVSVLVGVTIGSWDELRSLLAQVGERSQALLASAPVQDPWEAFYAEGADSADVRPASPVVPFATGNPAEDSENLERAAPVELQRPLIPGFRLNSAVSAIEIPRNFVVRTAPPPTPEFRARLLQEFESKRTAVLQDFGRQVRRNAARAASVPSSASAAKDAGMAGFAAGFRRPSRAR